MGRWTGYLTGRRRTHAEGTELRLLSAAQVLRARQEALDSGAEGEELDVWLNACVVARAVYQNGQRVYASGREVMESVSLEDLQALTEKYARMARRENPVCAMPEKELERWEAELGADGYERLKWQVLRAMHALPTEQRARDMTDGDYFYCGVQLALDAKEALERLCPDCRQRAMEHRCPVCGTLTSGGEVNPAFDSARFEELSGA